MTILYNIFNGNEIAIQQYYSSHKPKDTEISLAFDLYRASNRDPAFLKILGIVSDAYTQENNESNKEIFARFMGTHIGLDSNFFDYMKNSNSVTSFLQEYGSSVQSNINKLLEKIENGSFTSKSITINDLNKINTILSNTTQLEHQKTIPEPIPLTQYPIEWRLTDLKKPMSQEHSTAIEEDLLINVYSHFKAKNLPNEHLEAFIDKTRKIRDDLVKYSGNIPDTFSPSIYCIHADIISVIGRKENLDKEFNYTNLWTDTNKYNLNNIAQAQFKTIDTPIELSQNYNHNKVKEAIWVLTKYGELVFGETNINKNGRSTHHIDLANGQDVISAGTVLFSEDMKKVIAINPGSGHYKPSIESCSHMKKIVEKSLFDTQNTIICDYAWKPKIEIAPTIKPISINMDIINKNISLIKKNGLKESIDNTKVLPKFNKK